jgi:hypothetical protein
MEYNMRLEEARERIFKKFEEESKNRIMEVGL